MRWLKGAGLLVLMAAVSTAAIGAIQPDNSEKLQSYLAAAQQAAARKDFSGAADWYRQAVQVRPQTAELWADLGLMQHQAGKTSEATRSFAEAARLNPQLFVPQLFLGIEYLELDRAEAAIPFLERAEKLNPKDPQPALMLGRAYSNSGRGDRSSDAYSKAVALVPKNGNAWLGLGTAYLQQVESDAQEMTSKYADSAYVKLRAGELFDEQGKLIQAAEAYKSVSTLPSPPACSHAGYGIVRLRQEALSDARAEFDLESKSKSGCPLTKLGTAVLQLMQGDTAGALKELVTIWNTDPDFLRGSFSLLEGGISDEKRQALVSLAQQMESAGAVSAEFSSVLQDESRSDEPIASDLFEDHGNDQAPGQPTLTQLAETGEGLYRSGHYRKCSESLRPYTDKLSEQSLMVLATCAFYGGDYRAASLAARRLAASPSTRLRGLYWESKADQKLAIVALTHAGEIDADSPRMHVLLGDLYRQKRRWENAELEYKRAIALEPEGRTARVGLAIALFEDGKSDVALEEDKALLQKNPDDPEANLLAGEVMVQRKMYADAEPYLNKSRDTKPEYAPRLHVLFGEVYAATNRVPEALSEYKLGLATDVDGSIHYQLARLYQKTGDKKAADEAFAASKLLRKKWDDQASLAIQQSNTDISRQ